MLITYLDDDDDVVRLHTYTEIHNTNKNKGCLKLVTRDNVALSNAKEVNVAVKGQEEKENTKKGRQGQ